MISLFFQQHQLNDLKNGLDLAAKIRGFLLEETGFPVTIEKGDSLSVKVSKGKGHICYSQKNEFFRAVALLVGMLERGETQFTICEKSCLDMCGVMIDCSRNAVMKPEKIIDLFARIAMMGMNCVMLYTEDTYEIENYQYFGYLRGRYTCEELRSFDKVAQDFGLDMVPCIQTLAHLKTSLRWGYAKDIKDNDDILLIDEPRTYELIESMFKSIRSCCSSKRIHIGMDEADAVGLGNFLKQHGYQNRFDILSRHLNKVYDIAKKYDFTPMMWSDMFFRLGSKTGDYYDFDVKFPDDISEKIPAKMSMVYWDYYHTEKDEYLNMLTNHEDLKREIIFAGGIWQWHGMGPDYAQTFRTTFPALSACREKNIRNILATMWGDDGGDVCVFSNLLGIQLYAEYNFYAEVDMEHLKDRFSLCTGKKADDFLALAVDNLPSKLEGESPIALSRAVLYQDVLCGFFDKNFACFDLEKEYDILLNQLNNVKTQDEFEYIFDYYRALLVVLRHKVHIGVKIRAAYEKNDRESLAFLADELVNLQGLYESYHYKAYIYWHTINKAFGFERFDQRIGGVILRLKTAERKIREYLCGNFAKIEELEEKLLWYDSEDTKDTLVTEHMYRRIISPASEF